MIDDIQLNRKGGKKKRERKNSEIFKWNLKNYIIIIYIHVSKNKQFN
jgi:hypothetical protein